MRIRFNNKDEFHEFLFTYLYHGLKDEIMFDEPENLEDLSGALKSKGLSSILKKFFVSTSTSSRVQAARFIQELEIGNNIGIDIYRDKIPTAEKYLD